MESPRTWKRALAVLAAWMAWLGPGTGRAVVPQFTVTEAGVELKGVGPESPIIYDNDWWSDVFDNNYLWAQVSLGKADLRGNIVTRDMWDHSKGDGLRGRPARRCPRHPQGGHRPQRVPEGVPPGAREPEGLQAPDRRGMLKPSQEMLRQTRAFLDSSSAA